MSWRSSSQRGDPPPAYGEHNQDEWLVRLTFIHALPLPVLLAVHTSTERRKTSKILILLYHLSIQRSLTSPSGPLRLSDLQVEPNGLAGPASMIPTALFSIPDDLTRGELLAACGRIIDDLGESLIPPAISTDHWITGCTDGLARILAGLLEYVQLTKRKLKEKDRVIERAEYEIENRDREIERLREIIRTRGGGEVLT